MAIQIFCNRQRASNNSSFSSPIDNKEKIRSHRPMSTLTSSSSTPLKIEETPREVRQSLGFLGRLSQFLVGVKNLILGHSSESTLNNAHSNSAVSICDPIDRDGESKFSSSQTCVFLPRIPNLAEIRNNPKAQEIKNFRSYVAAQDHYHEQKLKGEPLQIPRVSNEYSKSETALRLDEVYDLNPACFEKFIMARKLAENRLSATITKLKESLDNKERTAIENKITLEKLNKLKESMDMYSAVGSHENNIVFSDYVNENALAMVYSKDDITQTIYFNKNIFEKPIEEIALTLVHELTHLALSTKDFHYEDESIDDIEKNINEVEVLIPKLIREEKESLDSFKKIFVLLCPNEKIDDQRHVRLQKLDELLSSKDNRMKVTLNNAESLSVWIMNYGQTK